MRKARFMPVILLLVAAILAAPAQGHSCSGTTEEKVGVPIAIKLGVPAEEQAVVGVEVRIPDGFRLEEADPDVGWTVKRDGRKLTFTGGSVYPFGCAFFVLWGEATRKGKLAFPLVTHHEDGSSITYKGTKVGDYRGAQLLFADTSPGPSDYVDGGGGDGGGGLSPFVGAGVAGLVIGGAIALARRRQRIAAAEARRPPSRPAGRPQRRKPQTSKPQAGRRR